MAEQLRHTKNENLPLECENCLKKHGANVDAPPILEYDPIHNTPMEGQDTSSTYDGNGMVLRKSFLV